MPLVPMIDARWACLMFERLKQEGSPVDPILKKAGLTRRQLSDPDARIPFQKHAALLSLAAQATGDGSFGLRLTTTIAPKQAGVLGYVLLNSGTLGDALGNLVRYDPPMLRVGFLWRCVLLAIIMAGLVIGLFTAFIGLVIILPVIGYGAWHGYLVTIDAQDFPRHEVGITSVPRPATTEVDPTAEEAQDRAEQEAQEAPAETSESDRPPG